MLRAGESRVQIPARTRDFFLFSKLSRLALGATPLSVQKVSGFYVVGVKRRGRENCHSPPSSDEVKNEWSYTSTPPIWYSWRAQGQIYLRKEIRVLSNLSQEGSTRIILAAL